MNKSPYDESPKTEWKKITEDLVKRHPLDEDRLVEMTLDAWDNLFSTSIGRHSLKIGVHIFPKPQVIGALLHELIPAEIASSFPTEWRGEETADDKDIVCKSDDFYSIELKTSSNKNKIFGNRSYAQKPTAGKKGKDGYYLAVNFEPFVKPKSPTDVVPKPNILLIRFGWLDHTDWRGQKQNTGQQSNLSTETYDLKFKTLYTKS